MKAKISTKLTIILSLILLIGFLFVFLVNTLFLPRYYLYKMENKIDTVTNKIEETPANQRAAKMKQLESDYQVTILETAVTGSTIDDLNENMRTDLNRKGIALNRFWITEDTLKQLNNSPTSIEKRYNQGKQKSSFLVNLKLLDQKLLLVGISMVDFSETATIINTFTFVSFGIILLVMLILVYFSTKKITQPLTELKEVAEEISHFTFIQAQQIPADEIGELALSINKMSRDLEHYQTSLMNKNQQLKQFTADLTHELKTPIAVIKAYGNGMKDELDDGTYLETILRQADLLTKITTEMLDYAKLEQRDLQLDVLNLPELLQERVHLLQSTLDEKSAPFHVMNREPLINELIYGDKLLLARAFDNLLTNALKYATTPDIQLIWRETSEFLEITFVNETALPSDFDVDKLWEAFYVHEKSRNKYLSGTGLGLPIVKTIMEQQGFLISATLNNQQINFCLQFKKYLEK